MADGRVEIAVAVDNSDALKSLQAVDRALDDTAASAKKAGTALDKSVSDSSRKVKLDTDKLRASLQQADKKLKGVQDRAGDTGSALGKLGAAASGVSPELASIAVAGNDAADALEGVLQLSGGNVAVAGALAGGLALVGGAYIALTGNAQRYLETQRFISEAQDSTVPTARRLKDANRALALATGDLTKAEFKRLLVRAEAQRSFLDFAQRQEEQRAGLRQQAEDSQRLLDVTGDLVKASAAGGPLTLALAAGGRKAADAIFGWSDSIEQVDARLGALDNAQQTELTNLKALRDALLQIDEATEKAASGTDARRAAADAAARSDAAAAAALEQLRRQVVGGRDEAGAFNLALIDLDQLEADLEEAARLDEEAALLIAERREQLFRDEQERLDEAAARAEADHERELERIGREQMALEAKAEREAQLQQQLRQDSISGVGDIAGAAGGFIDALAAGNEQAARGVYGLSIALAEAQIAAEYAVALMRAAGQPPPLNVIQGAAATAGFLAATAQLATAEPPTAHQGATPMVTSRASPDEVDFRLKRGESVLNTQASSALGNEGVAALNRGQIPGPQVIVVPTIKHRMFEAFAADNARLPGTVLNKAARAAQTARRVGHSKRRVG